MDRRNFFGTIFGLAGLGAAKATGKAEGNRLVVFDLRDFGTDRWHSTKRIFQPDAVLDFSENEIERIRAEFEASHQGADNSGKIFVALPGLMCKGIDS